MEENGESTRKQKRPFKVEYVDVTSLAFTQNIVKKPDFTPEAADDIPQFLCTFCTETFSLNGLKVIDHHIFQAHKTKIFCRKCKEVFENDDSRIKHEASCNNPQPFYKKMEYVECRFCMHLYRRDKLDKHVAAEHNDDGDVQPKKVSKPNKPTTPKNATSILDILTSGNKVSLTQASMTLKEKIVNFNKKLNSVTDESKPDEDTIDIKTEPFEEVDIKPNIMIVSNINISGLKQKLQISLKTENE